MKTVASPVKINTSKLIYSACFQAIMSYGVIFWGNSIDSKKVFNIQNKIIRIRVGIRK